MEDEPHLARGDEVRCPHCDRWHEVHAPYVSEMAAARTYLFVTCPKTTGKYFVGTVGSVPRWQWRRLTSGRPRER